MLHSAELAQIVDNFMPHGMCYLWQPDLILLHAGSDAIIALAYYSIPLALAYLVRKRRDLEFSWLVLMFAGFILACGTTHLLGIWTIWYPAYWLDGGVKLATAAISLATAILAWRIMPAALALPSRSDLATANRALAYEAQERERADLQIRQLNRDLESKVRARTEELEDANERQRQALREKQVLLLEVHHRVKNNLTVIQSLLTMQARGGSPELRAQLQEAIERIRALARVHDQLNQSEDASTFNLRTYLERLCEDVTDLHGAEQRGIACRIDAEPIRIALDAATPLVLIVNEVLSNAFKHAFPGNRPGQITLKMRENADRIMLTIADDGIGGSDVAVAGARESFGLRLVRLLSEQLQGRMTFDRHPSGTEFSLTVPKHSLAAAT